MVNRDRNLLFGVLAVQAGMITPVQLAEVGGVWATDPSRVIASRLAAQGVLQPSDRDWSSAPSRPTAAIPGRRSAPSRGPHHGPT